LCLFHIYPVCCVCMLHWFCYGYENDGDDDDDDDNNNNNNNNNNN
jgi:hypothetical protein